MAAVAAPAARVQAAPGIDAGSLDHPALKELRRIGALIVGNDNPEARAARAYATASLVAAGHEVVALRTSLLAPPRPWLLNECAWRDLDAVALVRISTDGDLWRVNVDIQDPEGRAIAIGSKTPTSAGGFTSSESTSPIPVYASYWFAMTGDEAAAGRAASTSTEEPDAGPGPGPGDDTHVGRPRLWVSKKVAMLGGVRLRDAEFYDLVGRPDLNRRNSAGVVTARVLGYTSLGLGTTALVLGVVASSFEAGYCFWPNTVDSIRDQPRSCDSGNGSWLGGSLALTGVGGALLIVSYAMAADPVPLETRKTLARAYNARMENSEPPSSESVRRARQKRWAVSAAPLVHGDGGVMMINGRF
ncbi:MAG TPA: hypothetical protein VN903_22955 [Polyangia bacterium]|jgi:hypothetical protein|nr:hypothetical protein [Polyangia bacterium]